MAESEELKSLSIKVKEKCGKVGGQESLLSSGCCQLGWGERIDACSKASSIPPPAISGQEVLHAKGGAHMQKQQGQF